MLGKTESGRRRGRQRMRWLDASPTRWTWVWASSGSWWWAGKPGVLQSMGLQRGGHDWATELNGIFKNETMPFTATWVNVEIIIVSVANHTEKHKYRMIALVRGIQTKWYKRASLQNRNGLLGNLGVTRSFRWTHTLLHIKQTTNKGLLYTAQGTLLNIL